MPGTPESDAAWRKWLYGDVPCLCESAWKSLGRYGGINMGPGWVRTTTDPDCPHHGDEYESWYAAVARPHILAGLDVPKRRMSRKTP